MISLPTSKCSSFAQRKNRQAQKYISIYRAFFCIIALFSPLLSLSVLLPAFPDFPSLLHPDFRLRPGEEAPNLQLRPSHDHRGRERQTGTLQHSKGKKEVGEKTCQKSLSGPICKGRELNLDPSFHPPGSPRRTISRKGDIPE